MSVFGSYSRYYDLLYREKDYAGEAHYIHDLIQRHRPGALRVLDLGCGTGRHADCLSQLGYEMVGVDRSEEMLEVARTRAETRESPAPEFVLGDVREVRLGRRFDVVLSLFHVMSYQTSNQDLLAGFGTIREHLAPGGVFLFDCWYGPAVLSDRPSVRVRRLEDERTEVTRLAEPVIHPNSNLVDVRYHVFVRDRSSGAVEEIRETHSMRYLFRPEVDLLLEACGLRMLYCAEFMSDREPGWNSWNAIFVGCAQ